MLPIAIAASPQSVLRHLLPNLRRAIGATSIATMDSLVMADAMLADRLDKASGVHVSTILDREAPAGRQAIDAIIIQYLHDSRHDHAHDPDKACATIR